jgi:hypothetical protein
MAQEESVALLDANRQGLSPRQRRAFDAAAPAHVDLRLAYSPAYRAALSDLVAAALQAELAALPAPGREAWDFVGLRDLVLDGLLTPARRDRLAVGVLLGPWPYRGAVAAAVARVLLGGADHPVGVERAAVRLLTKLQHDAGRDALLRLAERPEATDEGLRFVVGWGLGAYSGDARASAALELVRTRARLATTRRGLVVAAGRQRNRPTLRQLAVDPDPAVRAAADRALRGLGEPDTP